MALTFFWRCEGTTLDGTHDFSAGDTTATATNTPAINATAAKIGSNGQFFDSSSDRYAFTPTSIISTTAGAIGFWLQFPTAFPASGGAYVFYCQGSNANDYVRIETLSGGGPTQRKLRLGVRNNAGAASNLDLTVANLTSGTWYFVAAAWDTVAPSKRLTVLNTAGTVLENATSGAAVTAPVNITNWLYGDVTGSTGTMYIDNCFVADAAADIDAIIAARDITSYTEFGGGADITGDLAATEDQDTAAIAGEINVTGDLAATEDQDTAAIAGEVNIAGDFAATEDQDTAAIAGEVNITGDLAATEAQDTAAVTGTVEAAPGAITGDLTATEAQDTAAIAGEIDITGDLIATEAQDSASASGTVEQPPGPIAGDLSATEAQDTAAIAGELDVTGALAATEAQDVAAITGSVARVIGDLDATEDQDTAAIAGELADCIPKVLNMREPDLDGLLAVAFLDRFERFAKRDEDVAEVRLFYGVQYCPPYVAFTKTQFRALPLVTRDAIRNAGSAAGLVDTAHKSNA